MAKGEAVICVSNSVKNYVLENYSINRDTSLEVIHRGIDPNYFRYHRASPNGLKNGINE